jgi:hypothetical protein
MMVAWRWEWWAGNDSGKAVGMGKAVATAGRRRLARSGRRPGNEADDWAHAVLYFFSQIIQTGSNLILENGCLSCSTNSQFLHVASLGYYEHFSQLCRHPAPKRNRAKNPGTDSTFESLMNFKSNLILPEKSDKFPKIPS